MNRRDFFKKTLKYVPLVVFPVASTSVLAYTGASKVEKKFDSIIVDSEGVTIQNCNFNGGMELKGDSMSVNNCVFTTTQDAPAVQFNPIAQQDYNPIFTTPQLYGNYDYVK